MPPPTTIKAIVVVEDRKVELRDVALPRLRDDYVLVKVKAVGLNAIDCQRVHWGSAPPGARIGCDYAGVVDQVGPAVTKHFERGDRIAGIVHGGDATELENGAFGEWIVAKGDLQIKIPDNLSYEQAATLGRSINIVCYGLYRSLLLPLPPASSLVKQHILIYGSETAVGRLGIQFARLSGLAVITISPRQDVQSLQSLGVLWTFYCEAGLQSCAFGISSVTQGSLSLAWDCSGLGAEVCAAALSRNAERDQPMYASPFPVEPEVLTRVNPAVRDADEVLSSTVADPEAYEFYRMFWELTRGLLESGDVKPIEPEVNRGDYGLEGVLMGLDELRTGKVSVGTKLVYKLPG